MSAENSHGGVGNLITVTLDDGIVDFTSKGKMKSEKRWKWDDEKVLALLDNLLAYKTQMD